MKKVNHEENKVNNEELKEEINQDIPNTEETQEPDCGQEKAEAEAETGEEAAQAAEEAPKFLQRRKR